MGWDWMVSGWSEVQSTLRCYKLSFDQIGNKSQISKTKYKAFHNTCQLAQIILNAFFQTSKKFFIELMKNCQNRSLYTTRSDQFTKMRAFYKRQPFFIKKNYPLLFMKNSMPTNGGLQTTIEIFGKNIHPCFFALLICYI